MRFLSHTLVCILCFAFLFQACHKKSAEIKDENIIVQLNGKALTQESLDAYINDFVSVADSTEIANNYIQNWIELELMFQFAIQKLNDSSQIIQMVNEYRQQLYQYEIEKQYVSENLDTLVTDEEIGYYYDNHLTDYKLSEIAVKAHYLIMDVDILTYYHELDKVRRSRPDRMKELTESIRNTGKQIIQHDNWIYLSDLLREINSAYNDTVAKGVQLGYFFTEDSQNRYIVKINEMLMPGDTIPQNLIAGKISELIINQRKQDLIVTLKNDLFQNAKMEQSLVYNIK
jgi:hypothetical protein